MIEILFLFLGILTGIITGLMPGIGPTVIMLLFYSFFMLPMVNIWALIFFYFSLMSTIQYYGSVSASVFGVLGEPSSIPAVENGFSLTQKGKGVEVLASASTASYIGVLISMVLAAGILYLIPDSFLWMLKGKITLFLLLFCAILLIITSGNFILSFFFFLFGILVSLIGYDDFFETRIFTFGIEKLDGGIPMFPIFCGLLVIPITIELIKNQNKITGNYIKFVGIKERILLLYRYIFHLSIIRGSLIGFFLGLVPGSGYVISSNIANQIEKKFSKNKDDDTKKINCLISAESANNSGSISVLIPLLMLGLPIVYSEAIFLSISETKGFSINNSYSWFLDNWYRIIGLILLVNTINWLLAGVFFNIVLKIYELSYKYIHYFIIALSMSIMLYLGYNENSLIYYFLIFLIFFSLGMIIKNNSSKFIFIYSYFVSDLIVDEIYRMFY